MPPCAATECARRGRIVEDEVVNLVAQFRERGRGGGAGEARADDDDLVFPLVGRVDELGGELVLRPTSARAGRRGCWN